MTSGWYRTQIFQQEILSANELELPEVSRHVLPNTAMSCIDFRCVSAVCLNPPPSSLPATVSRAVACILDSYKSPGLYNTSHITKFQIQCRSDREVLLSNLVLRDMLLWRTDFRGFLQSYQAIHHSQSPCCWHGAIKQTEKKLETFCFVI
jgi:hypothetical protein